MFCLVYGFSNAASHSWHTPSTWGYLAAGVVLLAVFGWWQTRAAHPLLPPRVVLDRNRGGAYLAVLIAGAGMFGIFLFLTYYLQTILGYSPVETGVAFLPTIAMVMLFAQIANIFLMPRTGPKPLITVGMRLAAAGMMWLTRIGVHSSYASVIVGPMLVFGAGRGPVAAAGDEHRHLRRGALRRGCRLGHAQRRPATGRLHRYRPAQHHRYQCDRELPRQSAPVPGGSGLAGEAGRRWRPQPCTDSRPPSGGRPESSWPEPSSADPCSAGARCTARPKRSPAPPPGSPRQGPPSPPDPRHGRTLAHSVI